MAGNQTDARIRAQNKLEAAKSSGADRKTIATLQAEYDAARAIELGATGGKEQAGGILKR